MHRGFVAGRYRDGVESDIWTDVTRCAQGTFVRLLAACDCGWSGPDEPVTPAGFVGCRQAWFEDHLATVAADAESGLFVTRIPGGACTHAAPQIRMFEVRKRREIGRAHV